MSVLRLYVWQRVTAMLLVPLILGHIGVIFYASARGITASEILGRTRGSVGWGLFYGVFVVLAAVHGAIGVRGVCKDWFDLSERALDVILTVFAVVLLVKGLRAVAAVVLAL